MSRLPKSLPRLFAFALNALIALALVLPGLGALRMVQETLPALLYALLAAGMISLYGLLPARLRFLVPLAVVALIGISLLALPASPPARLVALGRSLLSGAPLRQALSLYMDALLPFLMLLLALFARLLMEGDPAFTLPLYVTPLVMQWFLGAREDLGLYFPGMLCLPLLYIHISHSKREEEQLARPSSLLPKAVALALALTLLASFLTPDKSKTQPQAERLAADIKRKVEDLFFFTSTRSMFSLRSQGYQPMGDSGLGGRPEISHQPVLHVKTSQRLYLRGTILDTYTGRNWYDSLSSQRHAWQSLRYGNLRRNLFDEELPRTERSESRQASVTLLSALPSTLFVPQRLRELHLGPNLVAYFNASSELFITRDLDNGDSYSFSYEPYVAGQVVTDTLARKLAAGQERQLPELPEAYYQLPRHLQPDGIIAQMARDIVGAENQPYQQALALMQHLKRNYSYSIEVPPAPTDLDFAAHFLFDQKSGYCTYFATAMTVLARSLGLPARYVEGFVADPQGAEAVTLTGSNAHAWTEIYVQGLGWVVFDATASEGGSDNPDSPSGDQPPPPQPPSPSPSPSPSPEPSQQPEEQPGQAPTPTPPPDGQAATPTPPPAPQDQGQPGREQHQPFPWWILLVLALAALMVWRIRAGNPVRRIRKTDDKNAQLTLLWQSLERLHRQSGQGIKAQETPLDYASRLRAKPEFYQLAADYSALRYGRQAVCDQAANQALQLYKGSLAALPWHRKARLALAHAWIFSCEDTKAGMAKLFRRWPKKGKPKK